ncbi:MAG: DUF6982 domain-containing protein, partial [Myxococcaceae bacterium]
AWSDTAAERPTDPGLDEPPPAPFDEAPAARPQAETRAVEFSGSPDEPVQLAAAAEFISYARQGSEAIELPTDVGSADSFEARGLAELTGPASPAAESYAAGVSGLSAALEQPLETPPDSVGAEGAVPFPPSALEPGAPEPEALRDEGAVPLEPAPPPLEGLAPATDAGAIPPTPAVLPPEALAPEALVDGGGAIAVTPLPLLLETLAVEEGGEGLTLPGLGTSAESESEGDSSQSAPRPSPTSTWAPGSAVPPVLGAEQFAPSGGSLGERGLDPWPEPLSAEPPVEEVVETVGDEDLVEELATPTPLPPFPVATPPGSGGIRGFQFPRPPPRPVPVPPTPPGWQRTEPGLAGGAALRAPFPSTGLAPTTPAPQGPTPARATEAIPPAAVAPKTPERMARPERPVAPAPVTPRPTAPASPTPQRTPTPGAPIRAAVLAAPAAPTGRPTSQQPRTPAPTRAPPALQPVLPAEDETVLPLLELVDEVEPPRAAAPVKTRPAATPPAGTESAFGPPMMLNPGFVDGEHRVVIHTLEGQVHRGTVHDLDLQDDVVPLQQPDGRSVRIPARRLKAVFFVLAPGSKPLPTRGERVQVTFRDGRQVVGYSEDHAGGEPGFFVVPSDARTNTARVYVYRGGVQSITTG